MIKSLNKNDIQITPFTVKKTWNPNTLDNSDLILWMSGSESGSLSLTYSEYPIDAAYEDYVALLATDNIVDKDLINTDVPAVVDGYNIELDLKVCDYDFIVNSSGSLALQQQDNQFITYQRGLNISGTFYPVGSEYYSEQTNPRNVDGTYMRLIYNTYKNLFYNSYQNPLMVFGLESVSTEKIKRTLSDVMDVYTIPTDYFGEKIEPGTVKIKYNSPTEKFDITDDSNGNLILSGSYFSSYQTLQFVDL